MYINGEGKTSLDNYYVENAILVNRLGATAKNPTVLNQRAEWFTAFADSIDDSLLDHTFA